MILMRAEDRFERQMKDYNSNQRLCTSFPFTKHENKIEIKIYIVFYKTLQHIGALNFIFND